MPKKKGPFRDGFVWVMAEKCKTCIFRPGNLMNLERGRVSQMKKSSDHMGSCIPCHETMNTKKSAVCRGYYDKHNSSAIQIAERLGFIREQSK